jgi:hypothetical protein
MRHVSITNKSLWRTEELMPLLQVAWAAAKPEFKFGENAPISLTIKRTRTRSWCCRYTPYHIIIGIADPGKRDENHVSSIGMCKVRGMNEIIVGVAAWCFAAANGAGKCALAVTRDAVSEYRDAQEDVDAKVAAAAQKRIDDEAEAFSEKVFQDYKKTTLAYKLSKVDTLMARWNRKIKLAETRLKTLRRRRAALIAAETRRKKA